jgi:hypothetical protein
LILDFHPFVERFGVGVASLEMLDANVAAHLLPSEVLGNIAEVSRWANLVQEIGF